VSKASLVITAIETEGITQAEAARRYGVSKGWVSKGWVSKIMVRRRADGDAALEPRSTRPATSPHAADPATVGLVLTPLRIALWNRDRLGTWSARRSHHRSAPLGTPTTTPSWNRLTPRVLDIDDLYVSMRERGVEMIDQIQGPPDGTVPTCC